jgi:ERCC4-related helicase/ERCC4-type nuclease
LSSLRPSTETSGQGAHGQTTLDAHASASSGPIEYIERPWIRPETIEKRAYQVNLAVAALSRPTLIVLPTGLGKTVVAVIVAADHLKDHPGEKVLMMAPTKPLVEQHARFLREHLQTPDNVDEEQWIPAFSGSLPPEKRAEMWDRAGIIVATPQVIANDIMAGRYRLRGVSLVIFDEAHRATGDYPYVWISDRYHDENPYGNRLGLTASPGSSSEKILEVCNNLGLRGMELRTDEDEDVRPYLFQLDSTWKKVPMPERLLEVQRVLQGAMKSRIDALRRQDLLRHVSGIPSRRELLQVAGELQSRIKASQDPPRRLFEAMSIQAQAMKIAHAQELVETQGAEALLAYAQRMENEHAGKGTSKATGSVLADPLFQKALSLAKETKEEDPKADQVVDAVRGELTVNDDPRIIVFANYRETCSRIQKRLQEVPGCRPIRFVGQGSRDDDKGLTQKEQHGLLQAFRDGTYNVLIATSVAEEGLDIPKTDLVIFHEPVPSEIRAIQRRGRTGRARAGRVIILMYQGTRDEAYHWAAQRREGGMRRELRALKAKVDRGLRHQRQTRLAERRKEAPADTAALVPPRKAESEENRPLQTPQTGTPSQKQQPPSQTPPQTTRQPPTAAAPDQETLTPPAPSTPPQAATDRPATDNLSLLREEAGPTTMAALFRYRLPGIDGPVLIVVDHRESRSKVAKDLESLKGVQVRPMQLAVADYALSDRVVVERKTVDDFLDSLVDGRLFAQARQLIAYPRPIMIIEGEGLTTTRNIPRGSVFAALAALTTDFGISVLTTIDSDDTAALLVSIAKREQTEPRRDAPLRLGKAAMNDRDRRLFLLEGLPGVSAVLARRLLGHFGTVEAVTNASEEELLKVNGIGRKTATEIRRILTGRK